MSAKNKLSDSNNLQKQKLDEMVVREAEVRSTAYNLQHEFVIAVKKQLKHKNTSLRELSRNIDKSAAHLSQVLKEGQNPTIRTIVEIASAVDLKLDFNFKITNNTSKKCQIMRHINFNWAAASEKIEKTKEDNSRSPWERIS